jgi:hypothetical protein
MLLDRFDVAAYAPQTMAFPVAREPLERLRAALRAVFVADDPAPYQRLWDELVPGHLAKKAEARWVVPSPAVERFCVLAEELLPRDVLETAGPALVETRAWLAGRTAVRTHPENWFLVEQIRSYLESEYSRAHPIMHRLADVLDRVRGDRLPELYDETPPPVVEDVSWLGAYRARLEGRDVPDRRGASEVPEWLEEQEPHEVLDEVHRRLSTAVLLEALVGPYRMSRGPGPFMGPPASARPLEDSAWHGLIEEGSFEQMGRVRDARVLEGTALNEAIRETEHAPPSRAWWFPDGDMLREEFDELYGDDEGRPWLSWEAVQSEWPRCRARFLALLEQARASGEAVLLVQAEVCSQGPGTLRPVGPADGELADG